MTTQPMPYYPPTPIAIAPNAPTVQQDAQRRGLRRLGNVFGLALIIPQIILTALIVIATMVGGFSAALSGDLSDVTSVIDWMSSPMGGMLFQLTFLFLIFVPSFAIAARKLRPRDHSGNREGKSLLGLYAKPKSTYMAIATFLLAMGLFMLGNFATSFINGWISPAGLPEMGFSMPGGWMGTAVYFLTVAAEPAFVEEFVFRGVMLSHLRKYGDVTALLGSSILFGLMHGNFVQIPFAFVGGLGMGYAVLATNSIWPAVVAHFANNALSCLMDYIPSRWQAEANIMYTFIFLAAGLAGAFMLLRRNPHAFRSTGESKKAKAESAADLPTKKRLSAFLAAPGMIAAIIFYLFEAFMLWLSPILTKLS